MLPPNAIYFKMDMPHGHQDLKIDTLKDLELFNNMKNLQNSVTINLVKSTLKGNSNGRLQSSKLKRLVNIFEKENQKEQNVENEAPQSESFNCKRQFQRSKSCGVKTTKERKEQKEQQEHFPSLPFDGTTITNTAANTTTEDGNELTPTGEEREIILDDHEYKRRDNSSDFDSAVSSAPPSISPQPSSANMQSTDIWQAIRPYRSDIEKLQKDIDALQMENERLRSELEMAKEQILNNEKITMEAVKNNTTSKSLLDRVKYLEERERELLNECNELKEQNELLEFRILEMEDNSDKWSQPTTNPTKNAEQTTEQENIWNIATVGSNNGKCPDIYEYTNQELSQRITKMLQDLPLANEEQRCLNQVLNLLSQETSTCSSNETSEPDSFSTNSSSDESSSDFEFVKSSTASPHSLDRRIDPIIKHLSDSFKSSRRIENNSRIIATVQPYNSKQTVQIAPHNSPNEQPRRNRSTITPSSSHRVTNNNSLSESGVFVESDFFSDASVELNASTSQADQNASRVESRVPVAISTIEYYKNRLRQLENKLLVYESSGDVQIKHLADRLQRELQLEKESKESRDRVEFLVNQNAQLEEEKCEFEEAENDTRLRLQRLELELEILSQRNVELELSKEALSAKYKHCRSECLILREDLSANETQLRNICEDKRRAKENLEFLHSLLPLLIAYNLIVDRDTASGGKAENNATALGNVPMNDVSPNAERVFDCECCSKLKNEVHYLQAQLRECKERCQETIESADSHWLDLELEYKEREKIASAKESSLKQKITQLESILHADSCAANEKIVQMEETEKELKNCLKRITKEQKDILNDHENILHEYESCREELLQMQQSMKPLSEELENEKKRNKILQSELCVVQKIHSDAEKRQKCDLKAVRTENSSLRREFQNCEVTNGELREEVATLEQEIERLQLKLKCLQSRICELMEEIRTKEEICARLENEVKRNEGKCLALELGTSKTKHFKYVNIPAKPFSNQNEDDVREWFI